MNSTDNKLLSEITSLTRKIEDNYPELQKYLDENRITISSQNLNTSRINTDELLNYKNTLKTLIDKYKN
ncbi:hypothetical protein FUA26_03975 [Seonamhaeicola algicola]|uniref:Uncharacterized protein n=1 Tax=Seonamhaeicola algicola TaxID=1719036 RepID=A0A5C7AW96_9FLAO|nr:hypothetical protein [Seonamhaeicola algicola]TXE12960.1 hypothetical protein FUA26_03975 [Seonamhaeicola algicola]